MVFPFAWVILCCTNTFGFCTKCFKPKKKDIMNDPLMNQQYTDSSTDQTQNELNSTPYYVPKSQSLTEENHVSFSEPQYDQNSNPLAK